MSEIPNTILASACFTALFTLPKILLQIYLIYIFGILKIDKSDTIVQYTGG